MQEQQVVVVLYGDNIPKYESLFALSNTYLVSCAKVRDPRGYSIHAGTYEWVVDRHTVVDADTNNGGTELPVSSKKVEHTSFCSYGAPTSRAEDNEQMLISYTLRSPSASLSSLNLAAIEDEVLPISTIPDCRLRDTITVTVSETVAETMLSLTAEQIYENVAAKREPLSTVRINQQFDHKLSRLQLQKPIYRFPDQTPGMLAVASFTEAETPVLKALSLPMASGETGKKQKVEPSTPTKQA
ncbi:hypothetical protein CQW23_03613 [Capsicum baccatum]|uniref:Uncharacterized protein n=1 Tax=Capsicum baccatum TaxID=33114 RepID=A0A2G2XCB7_CAPBA|nr:hypothetical protein CQW23_03613 [Capsicum baccatum]